MGYFHLLFLVDNMGQFHHPSLVQMLESLKVCLPSEEGCAKLVLEPEDVSDTFY